ncbi:MAG: carbonic anhydrase [Endozoicomonadaceae bacterium]|nr:carbonic anhydrase [Endozoicomonadaceae bacterium]
MSTLSTLFKNNQRWAREMCHQDPDFFNRLSQKQTPQYLWIGCCDSRVPPEIITGLMPGDLFVHRNAANQALPDDLNMQTALTLALHSLHIRHIIVAGHYACIGVEIALKSSNIHHHSVDDGLTSLRKTSQKYACILNKCTHIAEKNDRLSELNVLQQITHLAEHPLVQLIWNAGEKLTLHGIIYDIKTGLLKDLGLHIHHAKDIPSII